MKSFAATSLLAVALAESSAVTPIEKVIHLLNGMLESGKQSKHEEVVQFAAFKQFCDDTSGHKKLSIKEGGQKMEILTADIAKAVADTNQLNRDIADYDDDVAVWEGDRKAATSVRNIEKRDYQVLHNDYEESIGALRMAMKVLKQQNRDHKQAEDLLQLNEKMKRLQLIPAVAKKALNAFLQQGFDEGLATASEAAVAPAYEANIDKVVDMLAKLHDKFVDERTALEKDEMNADHAFKMLVQDLSTQITQSASDVGEARTLKTEKLQGKSDATDDLKEASNNKAADEKYLEDLLADCNFKAVDFEKRQVMRSEEIKAIEKAIEIIGSDKVSGAAEEHLPSLLQRTALAQLRAEARSPAQQHASDFLLSRGNSIHSKVLLSIATHVASDPFKKVKRMIKDLIMKLMEESNEEAEHKGWCDTELSTNEHTRKEKTEAVELLHAEIDELKASLTKLSNEITDLSASAADLNRAMAEAGSIRQAEKAKNQATMKDAQDAQMAVEQAIMVLRDFYAKAADEAASAAASLTQEQSSGAASLMQKQKRQPEAFDVADIAETIESAVPDDTSCLDRGDCAPGLRSGGAAKTALVTEAAKTTDAAKTSASPVQAAKGGGVLDMLDVILSDFAQLEAKTDGAEASAERQYNEFISDSRVDKAEKESTLEHKTSKRQDEEQTLVTKTSDLEGTQHELDSALAYFDKLKPSCVDSGVSYEDRVSRRKEEVESLQEALRILNGEDMA